MTHAAGFCPTCGAPRVVGARFCGSCGQQLEAGAPAPPQPPIRSFAEKYAGTEYAPSTLPAATPKARSRFSTPEFLVIGGIIVVLGVGAAALLGGGRGGGDGSTTGIDGATTPFPTLRPTSAPATAEPAPAAPAQPEEAPAGEPTRFSEGDAVEVEQNGQPWATITVSNVRQVKRYPGEYFTDTPKRGYIYLEALITYVAKTDGVDYNPFDWQVFVDGTAVDNWAIVSNGPTPQLSSGTLPKGRKAEGWVVYEVPVDGQVLISYGGNMFLDEPPVFEVVLRHS